MSDLLEATVWLRDHMKRDDDVRAAVTAALNTAAATDIGRLSLERPDVVIGLYEGLRDMVDQLPEE